MKICFEKGLYPAVREAGFRMEGYYVWCGSCIRGEDGKYYLFASRWPKESGFPGGYMTRSEIVLAETERLDRPFRFVKVLFGGREGGYFDSQMAHNPTVVKIGKRYYLYYIGTSDGSAENRKIGVAYSDSLTEGWVRPDAPLDLPENANNPSVAVDDKGGVLLTFRDGRLKVSMAYAAHPTGPFRVLKFDLFPKGRVEDMYLFRNGECYEIIAEDNEGAYTGNIGAGVHFVSQNGVEFALAEPLEVYGREVTYTDGSRVTLQRRERPQLLVDGERLYLFTTAKLGGETREAGGETWNMVQEYRM